MPAWLIPAIIAAVGAGASYLQQRAAGKSVVEQNRLYNEWLANRQTGVNDILERLGAGGFSPFGAQVSTSSGSTTSASRTNSTTRQSTRPVVTPEYQRLEGMWRGRLEGRLARPSALPHGYAERGVREINASYAGTNQTAKNVAARRGLSGEALFGLAAPGEASRAAKISDFLVDVPLRERELQNQDITMAADVARLFGLGSDTISNTMSSTAGSGTSSNTMTSPPNLGALASLMLPPEPFRGTQTGTSPFGQAGGNLAAILAWLYQQGAFQGASTIDRPVG